MLQDVRYALRVVRRQPAYTAIVVATLAIGIGASSAIFTMADRVLLRPLPFPDPDRLVWVNNPSFSFGGARMDVARSLRTSGAFADIGLFAAGGLNLGSADAPSRVRATGATAGFMRAVGVQPASGRLFTDEEDAASATVALISDVLWRSHFGARADILEADLPLNGRTFDIIGVMPPHFVFPADSDVWVLAGADQQLTGAAFAPQVIARLAPDINPDRANQILRQLGEERRRRDPGAPDDAVTVTSLQAQLGEKPRPTLLLLASVVALLMLATTANVAGLMLARMRGRTQEIAVRRAVGATRWNIARQLLIEASVMTSFAGVIGVVFSIFSLSAVRYVVPELGLDAAVTGFDARSAAIAIGVMAIAAILFGAGPALVASRTRVVTLHATRITSDTGSRARSALIVAQVAAAIVLLTVSAGAILTLMTFARVDHGFHNPAAVTFELTLPMSRYATPTSVTLLEERITQHLAAAPGIRRAGASSMGPGSHTVGIGRALNRVGEPIDSSTPRMGVVQLAASPDYFAAAGIPVLAGRTFATTDREGSVPVAVLSETAARTLWPDPRQAVGQSLQVSAGRASTTLQVVGVVSDVRLRSLRGGAAGQIYLPFAQSPPFGIASFVVDSTLGAAATDASIRAALRAVDPTLPPDHIVAVRDLPNLYLANERLTMWLTTFFGTTALLLCAVGLYGVLTQAVTSRTREIGIHMALGADVWRVRWQVVGTGLRVTGVGVIVGSLAAWLAARTIEANVPGLTSPPAWAIAAQAALLLVVALIAAWMPARRASAVDPVVALRAQ
jgi:predicted permease